MREHKTYVFRKYLLSQKVFRDQKSLGNAAIDQQRKVNRGQSVKTFVTYLYFKHDPAQAQET
jgi:hypothetical protein